MLGDFLTRAKAAGLFLAKAGGTLTGPIVLPGNPTTDLQAAPKQYVDANVYSVTDPEQEFYTLEAAKMEPGLIHRITRFDSYTVPADETHFAGPFWNGIIDEAKGVVRRFEIRNLSNGYTPLRGVTVRGGDLLGGGADGFFLNTTGVSYADARAEYFRKLKIIRDLQTRDIRNVGIGGISWVNFFTSHGYAVDLAANFDKFWSGYQDELGDGFDASQLNAADQRVHQEFRRSDTFRTPIVDNFGGLGSLGSGAGFDWAFGRDNTQHYEQHAPVNWVFYKILPLDFYGTTRRERDAPNGHRYCVSTVPPYSALPADAVDLTGVTITDPGAGGVTVDADTLTIRMTSSGTDFDTGWSDDARSFTPEVGEAYLSEFTYPAATKIAVGFGNGTGVGLADVKWGISVDAAGAVTVRHHDGTMQTTRAFSAFSLTANENYRLKVTFGTGGVTFVELQSTKNPGGNLQYQKIGTRDWWDLLEGTSTTGAGMPTGVRMKASVGGTAGTYYLLAWPRVALSHAGATSQPTCIWQDSLSRPIGLSASYPYDYPRSRANGMYPDRQGAAPFAGSTEIGFCNADGNRQPVSGADRVCAGISHGHSGGYNAAPLVWNPAVANVVFEGWYKVLRNADTSHALTVYFNSDSTPTNRWYLWLRIGDGLCTLQENTHAQDVYATTGSGFLGAYSVGTIIRWRITANGNALKLEITRPNGTFATEIDTTITSRLLSSQTYVGVAPTDMGVVLGGDSYGLRVRRA